MLRSAFFKLLRIISLDYLFYLKKPGRLYILMLHQVNDGNSAFYRPVPVATFEQICRFISKRSNTIYFSEIEGHFKKTKKPAFIITFDDGHYDILENAYPILKKYGLKFNMNIVTESIETGLPQDSVRVYDALNAAEKKEYMNEHLFPEPVKIRIDRNHPARTEAEFAKLFRRLDKVKRRLFADDVVSKLSNPSTKFSRMLSAKDVEYLNRNGAEVGSHTHSHPILPNCDTAQVEFELKHSKAILEGLCKKSIDVIAFPRGECNEVIVKKSFEAGYKYLLVADDRISNAGNVKNNIFSRVGLYYKTRDENLAKIFGFHQLTYRLKTR